MVIGTYIQEEPKTTWSTIACHHMNDSQWHISLTTDVAALTYYPVPYHLEILAVLVLAHLCNTPECANIGTLRGLASPLRIIFFELANTASPSHHLSHHLTLFPMTSYWRPIVGEEV